ncbi:MAG: hypothetical protein EOS25_13960 [Mesorhizobium sp.]|uniref:hypothetical protein n=1 Tax=Mesorhizobium sp. TaxID=1871066 RepID=UPI000FE69F19|nr:hypothetical protein [Mesorhizobium sp.]RWD51226.1 MAG: hypothetical protein EOS59_06465 [Mesorhizobium sp.]RWE60082.1 MAG: hypothetical protein EOS24_13320 [Mesorhizobium sp.]RWF11537.1 MAG: hypothetical protein EOS69_08840 [Mesorhizobium sp.]RWF18435.1 MAG: hypothetical protein EOS25_13960 [Mesorhizobium sp.]TIW46656.1 MAG: hypothetical protein E5V71_04490 [Mesorhizobium sp.]
MERVRIENQKKDEAPADTLDLLWGAKAISDFIGLPRHRTHYLIYSGKLPVKRIGKQILASKSAMRAYFKELEG